MEEEEGVDVGCGWGGGWRGVGSEAPRGASISAHLMNICSIPYPAPPKPITSIARYPLREPSELRLEGGLARVDQPGPWRASFGA